MTISNVLEKLSQSENKEHSLKSKRILKILPKT